MPRTIAVLSLTEPSPALLRGLVRVRLSCLTAVALIAAVTLAMWVAPGIDRVVPGELQTMKAVTALAALLSAAGLEMAESRQSRRFRFGALLIAALVTSLGAAELVLFRFRVPVDAGQWLDGAGPQLLAPMAPQSACGFILVGLTLLLMASRTRTASRANDLVVVCLGALVLVLVSGYIFGAMRLYGVSATNLTSPQTLLCLLLLSLVAFLRQAEDGVFIIFLGNGIASRIARGLAPFLVVLPFLREVGRSRLLNAHLISAHYATALLGSAAAVISFLLLVALVWYVNGMEVEIRELSLRDDLTGLYNLKGFNLFAEQALKLARRAELPFSVLFIDLDDLKHVNDQFGHSAGSAFLAETGSLLQANFRETDVLGRIGGDEFAVAGQFNTASVAIVSERLTAILAERNIEAGRKFPLNFSIGSVTSGGRSQETLDDLLNSADRAMYKEKRRRKLLAR